MCVSCPVGCEINVDIDQGSIVHLEGNRCPRGEDYARQEAVEPKRVLATSVRVAGGTYPLVSVRTSTPVPLERIPDMMEHIKRLTVSAPVRLGQVLDRELLGTQADLVATRDVPQGSPHPACTPPAPAGSRPHVAAD